MKTVSSSLRGLVFSITFFTILYLCVGLTSKAQAQNKKIAWYSMLKAQKLAKESGKKVLIFAEASWCVYCKKMKQEVFPQPSVVDSMNAYFYPVNVDIESDEMITYNGQKMTQQQFAQSTGMQATPTFFFLDKNGEKLGAQPGFIPTQTFSRLLGFLGSGAFKEMEFQTYLKTHVVN